MSDPREQEILALAVEKGFISRSDIALAQEQTADGSSSLDFLVSVNLIDGEIIERLRVELMQYRETFSLRMPEASLDGNATILPSERKSRVPSAEPLAKSSVELLPDGRTRRYELSSDGFGDQLKILQSDSDFPLNWERYSYVRFLGEGGMGRVFLAMDPRLKRYVAIKFVRGSDANSAERFLNEAQAQARVTHDNLCKVYEVGEVDGRPFIVMQFVEGVALNHLPHDLGLEQKLMLIRDVADALHQAHRSGLIHRDIKPSNIIVEHSPGQGYRPVVLDFGLARQQSTPGMTVTGSVIGTPHYMPPEQARGENHALDRRGDVYSVGATMYELLCGEQPFSGSTSINVLFQVINEDPQSLRSKNSLIPPDVETICFKCMEKNPEKRYESARALAEDISRYLDGEPIQARRTSLWYQLRKKAAKHKLTVLTAAIASAMLLAVLTWSWIQQSRVNAQAQMALQFGQEVQEMEDDMRKVYLIPLHNIRPHREQLKQRMEDFRKRMEKVGKIGLGPGNYALGSAYLALNQLEPARTHLELAWHNTFRKPEVAYALGRVMGLLYQLELSRVQGITDLDERNQAMEEINKAYREPALAYLEQVPSTNTSSPEYVESLLAFYVGEYSRALQRAEAAFARNPWFYEALILQGDIYKARGNEARNHGEDGSAMADYLAAERTYNQAAHVGESDPLVYLAQADLAECMMQWAIYGRKGDLDPYFVRGVEACRLATEADSSNVQVYLIASSLYLRMAEKSRNDGQTEMIDKGVEIAERALAVSENNADALSQLGRAHHLMADALKNSGRDATGSYEKSDKAYLEAISKNPTYRNYNRRGLMLKGRGFFEKGRGADPSKYWTMACEAFLLARQADPTKYGALNNLGELLYQQGYYELGQGKDASKSIDAAIQAYRDSLAINPQFYLSLAGLGKAYNLQANFLLDRGMRCSDAANQAIDAFNKAIQINKDFSRLHQGQGESYFWMALEDFATGKSSEQHLAQAGTAISIAIRLEPDNYAPQMSLGSVYWAAANQQLFREEDPSANIVLALAAFKKANELKSNRVNLFVDLSKTYALGGQMKLQKNQDPSPEIKESITFAKMALDVDPEENQGYLMLGRAYLCRARWQMNSKQNPEPAFELSRNSLVKALSLGSLIENRLALGHWALWHSIGTRQFDQDETRLSVGIQPLDEVLLLNPKHGEALALKGMLMTMAADSSTKTKGESLIQAGISQNANLVNWVRSCRDYMK